MLTINTSVPIISQSLTSIWIGFDLLLRLVGVINFIFISSHPLSIQGREPYFCYFVIKKKY